MFVVLSNLVSLVIEVLSYASLSYTRTLLGMHCTYLNRLVIDQRVDSNRSGLVISRIGLSTETGSNPVFSSNR